MREAKFIEQNQTKWEELEQVMSQSYKDPDKLNDLFIQVTDDLSYSRTFYPNRSVRVYLNALAQRIFLSIYRNRKSQRSRLIGFWTDELPQLIYESRRAFRLSFLVFLLAFGIGVLSCAMDPDFVSAMLGQDYVQMTEENIRSGDPMRVYKQKGEFSMTLAITINNIYVSFLTYVMGVFASIGSIAILIFNGAMLGAFQYFFIDKGLFWESFLTVWMHGTLEISAIIIAGAAGITMGQGLLFPGTHTRMQAFQRSARRGIKIMVGIVPIFMMAGFIEGYITRHTELPDVVRGIFIALCLAFVLGYFVWYPRIKAQIGFDAPLRDARILPNDAMRIEFQSIKTNGDIVSDAFTLIKKHFGRIIMAITGASALYIAGVFLFAPKPFNEHFYYPQNPLEIFGVLSRLFSGKSSPSAPWSAILAFSMVILAVFRSVQRELGQLGQHRFFSPLQLFNALAGATLLVLPLTINHLSIPFLAWVAFPAVLLWVYIGHQEKSHIFLSLARFFTIGFARYGQMLGLFTLGFILGMVLLALLNTGVGAFFFGLLSWIVRGSEESLSQTGIVLATFATMFLLLWMLTLLLTSAALQYFTLVEINEAPTLLERIKQIGKSGRIRGLEKE